MKRLVFILTIIIGLSSCENFPSDFPDYDYTSGYFPYQFPVRTLILGDYIYDNSNDNAGKFLISVAMGGVYTNEMNRTFQIAVDETLCNNVLWEEGGDPILPLPSNYYTLTPSNSIVIPKGKYNGGVEVQLTEAFFNDPLAIQNTYVVPVRLLGSADVDTILSGSSSLANPDVRAAEDWEVLPKNFTMFAVKYINEYHGTYFHYGESTVRDGSNAVIADTTYSATFVENNSTASLVTAGRNTVSLSTFFRSEIMIGSLDLELTFSGNNCTVSAPDGSAYTITGTGEFKEKEYRWGNKDRDGIVLNYTVNDGVNTYTASEVLVARDRAVVMEVFTPYLTN